MKKILFSLLVLIFVIIPVLSQEMTKEKPKPPVQERPLEHERMPYHGQAIERADVPKDIIATFEKKYPKAKVTGYTKSVDEGKTMYGITSIDGKIERHAMFNPNGMLVVTKESIQYADLPAPVRNAITKEYPKGTAKKNERVVKGERTTYEIVFLTADQKTINLVYDPSGKQLNKERKEYQ